MHLLPAGGRQYPGKKGDILAWAESSAVVYANSVFGARSNRNSGIIELFCGILGKAPEFGLLTDEGRRAKWLVEVKTTKVPERPGFRERHRHEGGRGCSIYYRAWTVFWERGSPPDTCDYLKDMGAASASNGAVGLYHVENITPEAVEEGRTC